MNKHATTDDVGDKNCFKKCLNFYLKQQSIMFVSVT